MNNIKLRLDELYFTTVDDTQFSVMITRSADDSVITVTITPTDSGCVHGTCRMGLHAGFVMEDGLLHTLAMANENVAGDITAADVIFQLQKDLSNFIPL
jgi:hypothetical protein